MEFEGKVILVTGASSGIGAEAARLFSKLGGKLALVGRNQLRLEKVAAEIISGSNAGTPLEVYSPLIIVADVTSDCQRIVNQTIDNFGQLDVLVNNAGINIEDTILNSDMEQFDRLFNTNVRSIIELTKLCVPHLTKTKGNVVNVSSICGMVPVYHSTFYSMSKAALDQFTKCSSNEFAKHGIRVNSVNPGLIETPIFEAVGMSGDEISELVDFCNKKYPVGRIGNVADVARCIAFLASDKSNFLTGSLYRCDGGAVSAAAY